MHHRRAVLVRLSLVVLLLDANQDSGSIVAFRIDTRTGRPAPTGGEVALETPVCIRFVEDTSR